MSCGGPTAGAAIAGLILGLVLGALIVILITRKLKIDWSNFKLTRRTDDEPVQRPEDIEHRPGTSRPIPREHDTVRRMIKDIQESLKEKETSPQIYHPPQRSSVEEHSQEEEDEPDYGPKQPYEHGGRQPGYSEGSDGDGSDSGALDEDRDYVNYLPRVDTPPQSPRSRPKSTENSDSDEGDSDGPEGPEEQLMYPNEDTFPAAPNSPKLKERCRTPPHVSDDDSQPETTGTDPSYYIGMDGNAGNANEHKPGDLYEVMEADPRTGRKEKNYDSGVVSREYPDNSTYSILQESDVAIDDVYEEHDPEEQEDLSSTLTTYATPRSPSAVVAGAHNDGFQSD